MYADVSVIVEGALNEEYQVRDQTLLDFLLLVVEMEAKYDGKHTQVFVVEHDHEPELEDCACAQYLTDHHPRLELNAA